MQQTPRSSRNKLAANRERAIAAAISEEIADLTVTYNRLGEDSRWSDPRLILMHASFEQMRADRAAHIRRAEQLEGSW